MGLRCNLDIRASFPPYTLARPPVILMRMAKPDLERAPNHMGTVEYQKGCPLCERSDPELERELAAWAQLLWDHFSSKRKEFDPAGVDSDRQSSTLKERSN